VMRVITATTPDHMLLRPREVMYIAMRTQGPSTGGKSPDDDRSAGSTG
jgi:hypothetical protein